MTPKQVLEMAKENEAKVVDLRFLDFPGVWQHFTVPICELDESSFEDGFGFEEPCPQAGRVLRLLTPIILKSCQFHPDPIPLHMGCLISLPHPLSKRPDRFYPYAGEQIFSHQP